MDSHTISLRSMSFPIPRLNHVVLTSILFVVIGSACTYQDSLEGHEDVRTTRPQTQTASAEISLTSVSESNVVVPKKRVSVRQGIFGSKTRVANRNFSIEMPSHWHAFDTPSFQQDELRGVIKGFGTAHPGGNPTLHYSVSGEIDIHEEFENHRKRDGFKTWEETTENAVFTLWRTNGRIGGYSNGIPGSPDDQAIAVSFSTTGVLSDTDTVELYKAMTSIKYAPAAEPIASPEPIVIADGLWHTPVLHVESRFSTKQGEFPPFSIRTPDRSGMTARYGVDSVFGSIGTSGISLDFEVGLVSSSLSIGEHVLPESFAPERSHWREDPNGFPIYFWKENQDAESNSQGEFEVGAYVARPDGAVRIETVVSSTDELEIALAIIRTIR
jgi:hypothetical protein